MPDPRDFLPPPPWQWGKQETATAMLLQDIDGEVKAIADYKEHIEKLRELGEEESAALLEHILNDERHHLNELVEHIGKVFGKKYGV